MYYHAKQTLIMVLTALCIFGQSITHAAPTKTQPTSDAAIEQAILHHINAYRTQHGLNALTMDARISKEAKQHSLDMARHKMPFGHTAFLSRIKHIHNSIKNSGAGAENVAYNYKDAQDVVKNWLRSPGHKSNIDGNYDLTGIGIARDSKGKIYFTQMFIKTGNSAGKYAARRPFPRLFSGAIFKRA